MEPPPAPTVFTSSEETRTDKSPTLVSRTSRGSPFSISATSVDVPPTSSVRIFSKPACLATQSAPATPPAGPDISKFTGASAALSAAINPPSERKSEIRPSTPSPRNSLARLSTYFPTTGRTAEFATVVNVLSYSCISGKISELSDTGTSGKISAASLATTCSCAPFK